MSANILGFNGVETAPGYVPDVTSYDYDAPLTEAGQVTDYHFMTKPSCSPTDLKISILSQQLITTPKTIPVSEYAKVIITKILSE